MEMKELNEKLKLRNKQNKTVNPGHVYYGVPTEDRPIPAKGHSEPWQRVLLILIPYQAFVFVTVVFEIGRKGTHLYEPVKSVPSTFLILVLGAYLLLGYLTLQVDEDMVSVIKETDRAIDDSVTFSEESALKYLTSIVGEEPRVSGTRYHLQKTIDLKRMVDEVARSARIPVHTDWQMNTGDFWINQRSAHVTSYHNVSNVIAVLEGASGFNGNETGSSFLVNCHYDSVPFALGASDNAVFCAVMLETLSRLSRRQQRFQHNIIFLFNGAEENGLQGSHAFISHPWFKGVVSVVNLDAAGMNGKATLFQVTDPRVLDVYKRVVHKPNAHAFGELLFSSGVIPSDTDFRIWRDFGLINGIDIAFMKMGHVYHTRYDTPSLVKAGVVQYAGNMLLNVMAALADSGIEDQIEPSTAVYYDYLNLFLVTYNFTVAAVVDVIVLAFAAMSVLYYVWLVGFHWTTIQELLFSIFSRLSSLFGGVLLTAVLVPIMIATITQLRYLSQPWMVVPMFWMPFIIGSVTTSHLLDYWRDKKAGMNKSIRTVQAMAATRTTLCLLLVVTLCVPGSATGRYLVTLPLFIMSACSFASLTVVRMFRLKGWHHLLLEMGLSLPSVMFVYMISFKINVLMLPVMGRTSTDYPDYLVGFINLALVMYVCCTVSGLELLFSRKRLWMVISGVLAVTVIIMFIPMSPYLDEGVSVQRHYWFHTEITTRNFAGEITEQTSGVLITKHDAYTTSRVDRVLNERGINLNRRTDFSADCQRRVHCNLPLYRPIFGNALQNAMFLYTSPPAPFTPPPSLAATRSCFGESCTLNFTMIGGPHNMLTIWPKANVNVVGWSFDSQLKHTLTLQERPVYVITHSSATFSEDDPLVLTFRLDLQVPISLQNQAIVDISHNAHKIQHPQDFTAEYTNLMNSMPKYFNIASFMTFRNNYEF